MVTVGIERLDESVPLPAYQTEGSAGMDLASTSSYVIRPGERQRVSTGIKIALPPGYEAQVRPRSGLATRYGVTVANAPGTIDSDYRGEIVVCLVNHGKNIFSVAKGDRIAQLVVAPVTRVEWEELLVTDDTERGSNGFGSTG